VAQEELLGALNQEHGVAALDALPAINELLKEFRIKLYPNPQKPKCYLYSLVDDETRQADAACVQRHDHSPYTHTIIWCLWSSSSCSIARSIV